MNTAWTASLFIVSVAAAASAANTPSPNFAARHDYITPYSDNAVALGDTRGNGILDIIQPGPWVMFGNGNGTFRPGPNSDIGIYGIPPVAIDLNGDGFVDLVTAGVLTSSGPIGIGVSFGNGDGTFQTVIFYQAGTDKQNGGVVVADFTGDGVLDAATIGESGIWFFKGGGNGTFGAATLTPFTNARINLLDLYSGDFNGDGKLDLLVETASGFAVFLGNGDGTFLAPEYITTPSAPAYIAVGDVNRDGHSDVVVTSSFSAHVSLYLGEATGGFTGPVRSISQGHLKSPSAM